MRARTWCWAVISTLVLLASACHLQRAPASGGIASARLQRVSTFRDMSPYSAVAMLDGHLYAGTASGLINFEARSGKHTRLTSQDGLAGDRVQALASHSASGLWVATDKGLSRYHSGAWSSFPLVQPPGPAVTAMVATGTGVWVGGSAGLGMFREGEWRRFLPGAEVSVLVADLTGKGLWVGTRGEGIHYFDGQRWESHSPARGQPIRRVEGLTLTPSGSVLAVGRSDEGECLAYFDGHTWTSYWPDPAGHLAWVQQTDNEVLLRYRDRILVLKQRARGEIPPGPVALRRRLGPRVSEEYPAPLLYTEPLERWLPADISAFAHYGKQTLIATRAAGLALLEGGRERWFHTGSLIADGVRLRMACAVQACFFPGADGKALRFTGAGFEAQQISTDATSRVQAFVDEPPSGVLALSVAADGQSIGVSRLEGQTFTGERTYHVTAPEQGAVIRFVRRSPTDELWVGLRYRDREGDLRPWGLVVLSPDGRVLAHRSTLAADEERRPGSLALPDDIRDVQWIGDVLWVATNSGACRVKGEHVDLFNEEQRMESASVHAFLPRSEGGLWAATDEGIGRLDGDVWRFDLGQPLNDATWALLQDDETEWAGTAHGLVELRKGQSRVWGPQDGLTGGARDLYLDRAHRLWALLTDGSLALISP